MKPAAFLGIACFAVILSTGVEQTKNVKVTIQLRGAIGADSVKVLRKTLAKIPGVKFKESDIEKGSKFRFFSPPFKIEIADLKKTDIGAIAKAINAAKTPLREELEPGLNLIVHSLDQVTERSFVRVRNALANVKGVATKERGGLSGSAVDAYYGIHIDNSGKAKINQIVNAIKDAGVKVVLDRPF